ncbi:MAG: tRNA (N6-threonylcarbamoyladenosine(37)-N6)-methyltransferase TrmO [Clostridia bacterium]|nr:tRNA (N6-threonylcarbamoyladenosine(37)-N6)-methyltransferase TrmO [Clostridia bacterium]
MSKTENADAFVAVAHIETDLKEKFGIPRQSGLAGALDGTIVFEPEYRNPDALRGLEGFSHIWLLWKFSESVCETWQPTVRPPRLGGNTRLGVFATRSPFRPNPVGLSCVELVGIEKTNDRGTVLHVRGADLMHGTPIYDIKPYIPYADCKPEAVGGFANERPERLLVDFPSELLSKLPSEKRQAALSVLENDPRPSYIKDGERVFGLTFADFNISFTVQNGTLSVTAVEKQ